jgi:hypothetical protein
MDDSGRGGVGVSRRDLIKKAAVAGGAVWIAPTVLASTASANQGCPVGSCPVYHRVKLDSEGPHANTAGDGVYCGNVPDTTKPHFVDLAGSEPQCDLPDVPDGATLVSTTCEQFNAHLLSVTDVPAGDEGEDFVTTLTLVDGFQWVAGFAKKGNSCDPDTTQSSEGTISNNCRTIVILEHSHIELLYCGPS